MDEWKRDYHKVHLLCFFLPRWTMCADRCWTCKISYDDPQDMGSLTFHYVEGLQWVTIIIVVSRRGIGSMTIIIHLASQVRIQLYLAVLNTDAIHRPEGCRQDVILFSAWYSIPSLRGAYGCPSFGEQRQHSQRISRVHFFHIHFHPLT